MTEKFTIEEIMELIKFLPLDLQEKLVKIFHEIADQRGRIKQWHPIIRMVLANVAGHNIVVLLKPDYASLKARAMIRDVLIWAFWLDENWDPSWD